MSNKNKANLKDIFPKSVQTEKDKAIILAEDTTEKQNTCLEKIKPQFDILLDEFLLAYLEMAICINENGVNIENQKDKDKYKSPKILYRKYSEILVIEKDIFEYITKVFATKSKFIYNPKQGKQENIEVLKNIIYKDFFDINNEGVKDTVLYGMVFCFVKKIKFEGKEKRYIIEEKKRLLEDLSKVLNTVKFTQNYDKDISDLIIYLNSLLEPLKKIRIYRGYNTVSK